MRLKYILGFVIIIGFIVFAGVKLKSSITPYVSLAEAQKTNRVVQVKGERVPGSERYDFKRKEFIFKMKDKEGTVFEVRYFGVKPSNFEMATEVVAVGTYENGVFQAQKLLVKCPSKYQAEQAPGVKS